MCIILCRNCYSKIEVEITYFAGSLTCNSSGQLESDLLGLCVNLGIYGMIYTRDAIFRKMTN